jgi:hypothetical protein
MCGVYETERKVMATINRETTTPAPEHNNHVVMFWGKRIEEMTREELIDVVNWCANEIKRITKERQHERDFLFDAFITPKGK